MTKTKTFTVNIDDKLEGTLDKLKKDFRTTRAEVFRMGIALLKVAEEARETGYKLTISDKDDKVKKEIVLTR